jgi:hypothetical protein
VSSALTELKNVVLVSGTVPAKAQNSSESVLRDGGACLAITEHVRAHIQSHRQAIEWIRTLSKDVFNKPCVLIVVLKS